jgi:single-stranded DNA-specific DHH superfamily exonuclease
VKGDAVTFLKNLKDNVKIIVHRDTDGVCSLAILLNFLERKKIKEEHEFLEAYIEKLDTNKVMIFLDISLDNIFKFITEATLVIDHHPYSKKIPRIAFYNPREQNPKVYIPASYLVYEVVSELDDFRNIKWVAALGVVGDRGHLNSQFCRDFIKEFDEEKLELATKYTFSAELVDHNEGLEKVLNIIKKSKDLDDFLNNSYLKYCYDEVQEEVIKSRKKIEKEGNVVFVEITTKYNVKSIIASKILDKYKNTIVVSYYFRENYCYISGRTNTNVDIGKIFKKVSQICDGVGGGHEKAAGARINKDKIDLFKEEILNEVQELN